MSEHGEKRKNEELEENEMIEDSNSENDSSSSDESNESNEELEQVKADFEEEDREGIKALLKQLFKKEPIELGLLTEHLINEANLCTVVKQLVEENVEDEDEDVFSLSSLIQLNKKEFADKPFIKLINKFLFRTAKENDSKKILKILEDQNVNKVLVLNERFINLPPKLGILSLQNLLDEAKNENVEIDYFIFISKLLKAKDESSVRKDNNKRSKSTDDSDLISLNGEDEVFTQYAIDKYEFKISDDNSDLSVQQNWKSGQQFIPYRRVLLLDQNGLKNSLNELKNGQ